ncbi:hypothetical protein RIF29_14848 [Crotalaria pallida]|uniref:Uncharacterized protein n=1 Tax=Crotalaria pallida TaxID=3830 RepID=A0AAN9FE06_CROPI
MSVCISKFGVGKGIHSSFWAVMFWRLHISGGSSDTFNQFEGMRYASLLPFLLCMFCMFSHLPSGFLTIRAESKFFSRYSFHFLFCHSFSFHLQSLVLDLDACYFADGFHTSQNLSYAKSHESTLESSLVSVESAVAK